MPDYGALMDEERSRYGALMDREDSRNRRNVLRALDHDPDKAAKARALAERTGVPAPIAERNLPEVERKDKLSRYSRLMAENPTLAAALADPDFAAVAHDDLDNLSVMQRVGEYFSNAGRTAALIAVPDLAGEPGFLSNAARLAGERTTGLLGAFVRGISRPARALGENLGLGKIVWGDGQGIRYLSADEFRRLQFPRFGDPTPPELRGVLSETVPEALRGVDLGGERRYTPGRVKTEFAEGDVLGTAGAAIAFGGEQFIQSIPDMVATLTALPLYVVARSDEIAEQRARNKGLPRATVREQAEALPFALGSAILERVGARGVIDAGSIERVGREAISAGLRRVATEGGQAAAKEGTTEAFQEGVLEYIGEQYGTDAALSFAEGFERGAFGALGGAIGGGGAGTLVASAREVDRRQRQAAEAESAAGRLREFNRAAAASKLRERSPEKFKGFIEDAAPDSNVYIDPTTLQDTLAQSGIAPDDLPAEIVERIGEAADAGADVRLTAAEFATHLAGKAGDALVPHMRTAPDAMSLSEAETFAQSGVDFDEQAAESEREAAVQTVRETIRAQLDLVGRFTGEANELYSELTASFYETQAARLGIAPAELYEAMPVRIVAESLMNAFEASGQRGAFDPSTNTIALLKNADLSTYLHESGHFFLQATEAFAAREGAPQEIVDDFNTVLSWFGVDAETWRGMDLEARREHHEKFARAFEAYLFEGKAPNAKLQAAFQRFRAWLVNVYRNLRNLNVELTPEVRAVFDRLLATNDEIREAQAVRDYAPLFESAEAAGMTPEQFAEYQDTARESTDTAVENLQRRTLRDLRWLSNAKGRVLKRLQKDAMSKRAAIRKEVAAEVEREAIFAARRFIQTGEVINQQTGETVTIDEHKLSLEALEDLYPDHEGDWSQLTRSKRGGVTREGGLHPDAVAEIFGFKSGDQLVQELLFTEPMHDAIEVITDERMLERYGDITDARALERAAEAEIANESRAKFLARELSALRQSIGNWPMMVRGATMYARERVSQMRIRDLRPGQFSVAEGKSNRRSAEAFKAGDTAQAARFKRDALVANRMSRKVSEAQAEVEKGLRYLARFNREGVRKNIDPEYLDQISALLERHDLRKSVSNRELDRRASLLEFIEAQREAGFEPEIPTELLSEARRTHYRNMTVEQWRGLVDSIRNIEHLGKLKNKLLTAQDERRFDDAVTEIAASIEANATKTLPEVIEADLKTERAKSFLRGFLTAHRKFNSLARTFDGSKDGGAFWTYFVRPLNDAANSESSMRAEATERLGKIFKGVGNLRSKKLHIPEIGQSLTREARIAIALNYGTETGQQRIQGGDNWSPAQAQAVLDTLDESDWQFVQDVWGFINSYWPQIAAKEKRVTGIVPEKVEGVTIQTRFGEIQGFYYPIVFDATRDSRSAADINAEAIRDTMRGLYARASTRRGHTKRRVETVNRPARKDLGVIVQHVEQVTHDLAYHEALTDTTRLLRAKGVDQAIRAHYGPEVLQALRDTLRDTAQGDAVAMTWTEKLLSPLRKGVTVAFLGWNLSTAALQPLGLTQSFVRLGPKYMGRGLAALLGDPVHINKVVAEVYEKSELMKTRGSTMNREISEIRNRVRGNTKRAALEASYFYFIKQMQKVADFPSWLGGYAKALDEGHDEATAVRLADQAVIDSQGGGATHQLAEIQRGNALQKLFTNFISYLNTTLNLTAESFARTSFKKPGEVALLGVDLLMLYSVPTFLAMTLRSTLRGDDEDDESLWTRYAKEQLGYMLGMLIGGRELASAVQGYDYSGPAGLRFFAEAGDLYEQATQGEVDEAFWKSLNTTTGILAPYPAGQVERTVVGAIEVSEGDAPLSAVLFGPPRED